MNGRIPAALLFGALGGAVLGLGIHGFLPGAGFSLVHSMPVQEMLRVFLLNLFLASLIVFGGTIFSITELRFYSNKRAYRALDRTVNPLYSILKRVSPEYKRLGPLWRSLYLALSFPLICLLLIAFTISLYLALFMLASGPQGLGFSMKLIPHISLEVLAFSYAAKVIQDSSVRLRGSILKRDLKSFRKECRRILGSRGLWKRLLAIYVILFLAAVLERFFVEI